MNDKKIMVTQSSMPTYEEYIEAIKPLWESCRLTNMGAYHRELECKLKEFLEVPELSLMVNGHMALEMAIQGLDFPEGGEVITTPFTFVSTTHAIVRNRLVPVFCDVKAKDGTIDEEKIEELINEKTVAILPVHVYGNVCNVERIQEIAEKNHLKVIYDAAHAFGVTYKGKGIGTYGDASVFSFHATKVFNTIEGGAVTFRDPFLYEKLYDLKNFGIRGEELVVSIGANAKMNEFSAIMGLCNLKHINVSLMERKRCFDLYKQKIQKKSGIRLFSKNVDSTQNYAYMPILIEDDYIMNRDNLYNKLRKENIYARKYFYPLTSNQVCYKNKYQGARLTVAQELAEKVLVLPLYEKLENESICQICDML